MFMGRLWGGVALALFATTLIPTARTAPSAVFPLNAQLPPVGRVFEFFQFNFSPASFTSASAEITYNLSRAPSWLHLDPGARSLFGTPLIDDVGSEQVTLTAVDSTGSTDMEVTLIVSANPSPKIGRPLSDQLATFGPRSGPNHLLLAPSTSFTFAFAADTFSWTQGQLNFYAILSDNTPLPSWMYFDPDDLSFSGTTPPLSPVEPSQHVTLKLIGSDFAGFSAASAEFSLIVSRHQLRFDTLDHTVNVTVGQPVNVAGLRDSLKLDGSPVRDDDFQSIQAAVPDWLSFDRSSLSFSGKAPRNASTYSVTVSMTDVYGDVANATVAFRVLPSLIMGAINDSNATIGEDFCYGLPHGLITNSDVEATSKITPTAPWLSFDATKIEWRGKVPADAQQSTLNVILTVTSRQFKTSDSSTFKISLVEGSYSPTISPSGDRPTVPTMATGMLTLPPRKLDNTKIVAAVVVPLSVIVAAAIVWSCARRQWKPQQKHCGLTKSEISRPLGQHTKGEGSEMHAARAAPRLPLPKTLSVLWSSDTDLQHLPENQRGTDSRHQVDSTVPSLNHDSAGRGEPPSSGNGSGNGSLAQSCEQTNPVASGTVRSSTSSAYTTLSDLLSRFTLPPRQSRIVPKGKSSIRWVAPTPEREVESDGRGEGIGPHPPRTTSAEGVSRTPSRLLAWKRHPEARLRPMLPEVQGTHMTPRGIAALRARAGLHRPPTSAVPGRASPLAAQHPPLPPPSAPRAGNDAGPMRQPSDHQRWNPMDQSADGRTDESHRDSPEHEHEQRPADFHDQVLEYGVASRVHRPSTSGLPGTPTSNYSRPVTPRLVELRKTRTVTHHDQDPAPHLRSRVESHAASLASIHHSDTSDHEKAFV